MTPAHLQADTEGASCCQASPAVHRKKLLTLALILGACNETGVRFLGTAASDCSCTTYDRSNGKDTSEAFSGAAADELRISSLVGCRFCEVDFQGRA